jgi:hypothetical protein
MPLPIGEDFVFAFEDVKGFVLILVRVGWRTAAGRRGLDDNACSAPGHFAGCDDIDVRAQDIEALEWIQVTSESGNCGKLDER